MAIGFTTNNVIEARFDFRLGDSRAFNILHWRVTNVIVTATGLPPAIEVPFVSIAEDLAGDLYAMFAGGWAGWGVPAVVFESVTVQNVHPAPRSLPITYTPAVPTPGTAIGDALPLQDTPTILKKTDFGERWGMGRLFVVGGSEDAQNSGVINAGGMTALNNLADVLEAFNGGTVGAYTYSVEPVLFTQADGGPRINPIRTFQVSDNLLKTQRRRRPGKGI